VCHSPEAESKDAAGAPAEIEITPAMIAAGATALFDLASDIGTAEIYAEKVIRLALSSAAPRRKRPTARVHPGA